MMKIMESTRIQYIQEKKKVIKKDDRKRRD